MGVRAVEHHRARLLVEHANFGGSPLLRVGIEPYPVNIFGWFAVVETKDYFQTGSVDTEDGEIETDERDVIFKPRVTRAVQTAKASPLGRVYLDWSVFPVVSDRGSADVVPSDDFAPDPLDRAVEFRDLRFAYPALGALILNQGDTAPLSGWVDVKPNGSVDAMVMAGRVQR